MNENVIVILISVATNYGTLYHRHHTARFQLLIDINLNFLFNINPEQCNELDEYIEAKKVIDSLKVVNDVAERSVALMTSFNDSITKDEDEKQRLLQVVENHRKTVPDTNKQTLQNLNKL